MAGTKRGSLKKGANWPLGIRRRNGTEETKNMGLQGHPAEGMGKPRSTYVTPAATK